MAATNARHRCPQAHCMPLRSSVSTTESSTATAAAATLVVTSPTTAPTNSTSPQEADNLTMTGMFDMEYDTFRPIDHPQLGESVAADTSLLSNTTFQPPLDDGGAVAAAATVATPGGIDDADGAGQELLKAIPYEQIIFVVCASSIIAATIFGNVMVVIAVFAESKLRKVGNFFIVSLAVSDLLVGIFVTPVALVYHLLGRWTFGPLFCDFWIAMDVVCCTASIVNLCVISFDRYNAITQPLRYALRRTASRAIGVIGVIWTYSTIIAVPPFLGWSDDNSSRNRNQRGEGTCMISQNVGYTIFSTVGAYYLPLFVMIVMYFKVFRATLKRKRNWIPLVRRESQETIASQTGGKQNSVRRAHVLINVADSTDHDDHEELVERVVAKRRRAPKMSVLMTSLSLRSSGPKLGVTIHVPSSQESLTTTPSPDLRAEPPRYPHSSIDETSIVERDVASHASSQTSHASRSDFATCRKVLSLASSTESTGDVSDESGVEFTPQISPASSLLSRRMSPSARSYFKATCRSSAEKRLLFQKRLNPSFTTSTETTTTPTTGSDETLGGNDAAAAAAANDSRVRFSFSRRSCKFQFRVESEIQEEEASREEKEDPAARKLRVTSPKFETSVETVNTESTLPPCVDETLLAQSMRERALTIERGRRRQRLLRRRRKNRISLNQERRAAKTLGVIMGCFVICWMPFFVLELIKPFCADCRFDEKMLKAFTWLGYLNSALNPVIYTCFNQDFRKGFQRIMCCVTKR